VLRSVPPTFTLPCPPMASNTAATPAGSSTSGRQAQVQAQHPRRGRGRQRSAKTSQQRRQDNQAPNVGPSGGSAQQLAAEDERVQALDTLGLMLGCITALQRTLPLLSPTGPDLGEIKASSTSYVELAGVSAGVIAGVLMFCWVCLCAFLLVAATVVQHAHKALWQLTSCSHSPAHTHMHALSSCSHCVVSLCLRPPHW
jgi:hypothetical protein